MQSVSHAEKSMANGIITSAFPMAQGYLVQEGITLETGFTLDYGGYTIRRGICFFNFRITATAAFSGNKVVLTGLPAPAVEYVYCNNSVLGAQTYVRNLNSDGQLAFRTSSPSVNSGVKMTFTGSYIIDGSTYDWSELPPGTATDQLIARVAALEEKCTMQTLVDIQSGDALDGTYMFDRTARLATVSQERVARYGDVVSWRLLITAKAVDDSGNNTAWSCAGNSLKTLCTTSLIPAFPYRVACFDNNNQGTIVGVMTVSASNGNISFEPCYRVNPSGTTLATMKITEIAAGESITIQAYATYPLKTTD